MNQPQHDPLNDYFTSVWARSLSQETNALLSDFSTEVLKKIIINRRKELLFNLACLLAVVAGIVATVVFVYPGYKQLRIIDFQEKIENLFLSFSYVAHVVQNAFQKAFVLPLTNPESGFMFGLFTYPVLLAALLWGMDWLLRRGHIFQS